MRRLLVLLSGANSEILKLVPSERLRFETLGAAVLIASCLAATSMWFALTTALGVAIVAALPIALLWGLIIGGIDRWLLTSIPIRGGRSWIVMIPRVILSALLGSLVSTPLVLRIFQSEITAQIARMNVQDTSGLIVRLRALDELSSRSLTIEITRWPLLLLFILLECLPVLLRLLQSGGVYEEVLKAIDSRERADFQAFYSSKLQRSFHGKEIGIGESGTGPPNKTGTMSDDLDKIWSSGTGLPNQTGFMSRHDLEKLEEIDEVAAGLNQVFLLLGPPPNDPEPPDAPRNKEEDGGGRT